MYEKVEDIFGSCATDNTKSRMTCIKLLVFVLCLSIPFSNGESKKITELPKEEQNAKTDSSLPPSVQTKSTNSSSLSFNDSTQDLSTIAASQNTHTSSSSSNATNTTITAMHGSSERASTTPNPISSSDNIESSPAYQNETFDGNGTTSLGFENVFPNDTLEFTNSTSTAPVTDPTLSDEDPVEHEDDLSVRQTMFLDDYCTCDIKIDICDVGCCCDEDCSAADRGAFSECLNVPRPLAGDSQYCIQKWVLQRRNTEYTVDTSNPNLFCITRDNFVQRTSFPPLKVIRTQEDFQKLSQTRRNAIRSPDNNASPWERPATPPNKPYQQGDLVWAVSFEGSLFPLGLPSVMFTSSCETESLLKYLTDFTTECQRKVHLDSKQLVDKYLRPSSYTSFYVLMQPSMLFEEDATTTTTATESTSTTSSTSSSTTPTDGSSPQSPYTSSTSANSSLATTEFLENSATASPTDASKSSGVASTTVSSSASENNTIHATRSSELTTNASNSAEIQSPTNSSVNSTNLTANLQSSDDFILLEGEPSIFNDTVLCEVQVILCFKSLETVCHSASDLKTALTECSVVTEVNYVIFHNGSEGIKSVTAKITVKDICSTKLNPQQPHDVFDEGFKEMNLKQKFTVEYRWIQDKGKPVLERSGRPGYLRGKPLLFGRPVTNVSEEGLPLQAIAMESDIMRGLTVVRGSATGDCTARTPVLFGQNMQSQCVVRVSPDDIVHNCTQLRARVRNELLGEVLSDSESDFRIGAYGDSDVLQAALWVPLLRARDTSASTDDVVEEGRCPDLVTSMTLEVAYALQGSLANPQAKVVGAMLTEGPLRPSPPAFCVGPFCPANSNFGGERTPEEDARIEVETNKDSPARNKSAELRDHEGSGEEAFEGSTESAVEKPTKEPKISINKDQPRYQTAQSRKIQRTETHFVEIELSSRVIFIDVTEPSKPAFPDPPRLDIKLPENFFYPLVPSSTGSNLRVSNFFTFFCLSVAFFH